VVPREFTIPGLVEALVDFFTAEHAESAEMDFKIELKNRKGK
jgi:hypothetical protein